MASPEKQLEVFGKIENEKIEQMFEMVDESIINNSIKKEKLVEIINRDLTNLEVKNINNTFYNFTLSRKYSDRIIELIEDSKITLEKQNILKKCFTTLLDRLSEKVITDNKNISYLKDFGHPHIHALDTVTEFRPLSDEDGKIIKLIPSIVFSGSTHNPDHTTDESPLNFQMNLKSVEELIKNLQETVKGLNNEIESFKEKFGDDIIE